MNDSPRRACDERRATLSRILKALRRRRGLRSAEAARAMGMSLRSYQRFEAGEMNRNWALTFRFADLFEADPWAIGFAVEFGNAEFALYCADNKAAGALLLAMRRFALKAGRDIAKLDPRSLLIIFTRAFEDISLKAREYEADLEQWMFEGFNGDPDPDQA
jgi:transcriptional regulator with XRE-family HTH domain